MTTEPRPPGVLVAIPAHNEAGRIAACLTSVLAAGEFAMQAGAIRRLRVAVGLHRCADETPARARTVLAGRDAILVTELAKVPVGTLRTRIIEEGMNRSPLLGEDSWIFSTDADSVVPPEWISATLAQAKDARADLVLGLTDLEGWAVDAATRAAYERVLDDGMRPDGHTHAYAANLAVRWSVFQRVGGFPGLQHGEEHGLARAIRDGGFATLSTLAPRVRTSARMPGRAADGLGALLLRLARTRALSDDGESDPEEQTG